MVRENDRSMALIIFEEEMENDKFIIVWLVFLLVLLTLFPDLKGQNLHQV